MRSVCSPVEVLKCNSCQPVNHCNSHRLPYRTLQRHQFPVSITSQPPSEAIRDPMQPFYLPNFGSALEIGDVTLKISFIKNCFRKLTCNCFFIVYRSLPRDARSASEVLLS